MVSTIELAAFFAHNYSGDRLTVLLESIEMDDDKASALKSTLFNIYAIAWLISLAGLLVAGEALIESVTDWKRVVYALVTFWIFNTIKKFSSCP